MSIKLRMKFRRLAILVVKRVVPLVLILALVAILLGLLFFDSVSQAVFEDATEQVPGDLRIKRFSPSFGGVTLKDVEWTLDSKEPVFEASEIFLNIGLRNLMSRDWYKAVTRVKVSKPGLRVTVDPNGNVNLMSLIPSSAETPKVDLSAIRTVVEFEDGWILYNDRRDSGFLYELSDWSGTFRLSDGETLQFETTGHPDGAEDSSFGLNGWVALERPQMVAEVVLSSFNLEPFTGFPGFGPGLTYVRGKVNGSIRASGEGTNWTELIADLFLVGDLSLEGGAFRTPWMPASFTELAGQADLLGSGVSTDSFQGKFADIAFELVGKAGLGADSEVDGRVTTERFPIKKLAGLLSEPIPLESGDARAIVEASGPLSNVNLKGSLFGYELVAQDQTVTEARADFLKSGNLVYIPEMMAETSAGEIEGEGWVFLGDEIRVLFEFQGDDTRPDAVMPGIAQRADFKVKVLGDPALPTVFGSGSAAGLGDWAQGLSQAEGKFIFSGQDLMLYDGRANSGSSVVNLNVGSFDLKTKQFAGLLSALNFRAEDVPGLQGVSGLFSGQAMVEADLSGETPRVEAQAVLSSGQFQSGELAVTDARGEAYFDGTQVVIPWARSLFRGSEVELAGVYDTRNSAVKATVKSPNFDLAAVGLPPESANLAATLEGRVDGDIGVYGFAGSSRGRAALSAVRRSSGRLSGVAWVDGTQNGVDVETVVVGDGTPSEMNFEYTGRAGGPQLAGFGPLDLFGAAHLAGSNLTIKPTLFSAPNATQEVSFYPLTTYSGAAYSFFGPLMAGPLEKVVIEESPFPTTRSALVAGKANLGTGALDLKYHIRMARLEDAPFPVPMESPLPFELLSGYGRAGGRVLGTLDSPKVQASFHLPWLMLEHDNERRLTMGVSGRLALGRRILEVPQITVSENPFDGRLEQETEAVPGDGLLGVSGQLKMDQTFDLRLKTQGFSPSFLAFFAPEQFARFVPSGRLATDSLHVWGSIAEPALAGEVRLLRGGIMLGGEPYPINSASVDFSSQGGEIRIPRLSAVAPGVELTGSLRRRVDGELEGEIRAEDMDLAKIRRVDPLLEGLSGRGDLVVKMGGAFPSSPVAEVGFRGKDLIWNNKHIGGRDRDVAIETLVLGVFEEEGMSLRKGLTIAPTDSGIFLELPAQGFRFQRASEGLRMTAGGAVNLPMAGLTASNFKTFQSLMEYFASPDGPDFGRQGVPFEVAFDNLTTRELARLTGRRTRGLSLSTDLAVRLEGQWWRDHQKDAGDSLPRYELALGELSFQSGRRGERTGFGLNKPANVLYQREGTAGYLSVQDFEVGFTRQEQTPEESQSKEDEEETRSQFTEVRAGVVRAGGRLAVTRLPGTEPQSNFAVDADDIPLANLEFLLPSGLPLTGMVDFLEVDLQGVLPSPKLHIDGEIADFGLGPVTGMEVDGSISAFETEGAYRIVIGEEIDAGITVTFQDNDVTAHGAKIDGDADLYWVADGQPNPNRLELFAKNLSVSLDSPINLTAAWIDKNLAVLAGIVPGKVNASGTLEGRLTATGTLRRPEFEGLGKLEDGTFDSADYGRFDQLNLDAQLTRITRDEAVNSPVLEAASSGFLTRLRLNRFGGNLGGKPFIAGGIAEFAGIVPTLLDLHMKGDALPVRLPDLFVGQMDMDLELNGREVRNGGEVALRPELTGLMVFPSGEFRIPLGAVSSTVEEPVAEEEPEDGRGRRRRRDREPEPVGVVGVPLDISLDLSLGSEFFVNALSSRVRTVGDLQIRAFDGVAKVYGQVALSRGVIRIPFYDASFRVRQGLAIFDGPLVPRLEEVEAVADLGGYRITARANGRYPDTFSLDLYSDPPLPQSELSRIAVLGGLPPAITGGPTDPNGSQSALGTLGATGASFLSGMLTNRLTEQIANTFFLSELSFDYIPPATYAVKIAKALDPNDRFLLTVTRIIRDNGQNENLYGIEWRFTRSFLLRTAFDQLARIRLWVQSINRF